MEGPVLNSEFVRFWNEILVPKFVRFRHILVDGLSNHSAQIFPNLPVKEGDKVLDVGCGFGDTAMLLAKRTGPSGEVVGIDCCDGFLNYARDDLAETDLDNVRFIEGDAQLYPFEPEFDYVFARFGTQFFENPVAGLKNMRRALKPGGQMTMIVWRTPDDNPWLGLPKEVIMNHLPPPGEDARSCGPGPFSMADQEMVTKQLEIAGYDNISFQRIDASLMVGNSVEDAVDFQLALGPAGEVYREAGDEAVQKHDEIVDAISTAIAPYADENGVMMDSSSWVISARNPG